MVTRGKSERLFLNSEELLEIEQQRKELMYVSRAGRGRKLAALINKKRAGKI